MRTVQDKYVSLYKELITQQFIYATAIRVLAKGYLPISLIIPLKLKEILNEIEIAVKKTNLDYDLVIKKLHLYYDMKLVTFGIDKDRNLIIQFSVFIQPINSINSLLYLRTVQDKYVSLYKELITQQCIYATAIRVLAKGYLPISLIIPLKLKKILNEVEIAERKTNLDYDLVIKRLHLCYDMKLVTFGIDKDRNLIIQFPVFIQPYTQQAHILYQIQTVPVPIIDQNKQAHSYTHLQIQTIYS